jgi:hypothetical protein
MDFTILILTEIREFERSRYTIEDFLTIFGLHEWPRSIHRDILFGTDGLEEEGIERMLLPREECSLCDRELRFDDICLEECRRCPEPMATRTGTMMRIKWKIGKRQIFHTIVTYRTIGMKRKVMIFTISRYRYSPISLLKCDPDGVRKTYIEDIVHLANQTIDDNIDEFIFAYCDIYRISYRVYLISHLEPDESSICHLFRHLFATHRHISSDKRSEYMEPISFTILRYRFDDIFETIFFEWDFRVIDTIRGTYTREE